MFLWLILGLVPSPQPLSLQMVPEVLVKPERISGPLDARHGMSMEEVAELETGVLDSYAEGQLLFLKVYDEQFFYVTYYFKGGGLRKLSYCSADFVRSRKEHYEQYKKVIRQVREEAGEEEHSRVMVPNAHSLGHSVQVRGLEETILQANHRARWSTDKGELSVRFWQSVYTVIEVSYVLYDPAEVPLVSEQALPGKRSALE